MQEYIKSKDYNADFGKDYFLKLSEEVGELSKAMRKNLRLVDGASVKETIEEELWDVIYYVLAIANCYDIDLEKVIPLKEKIKNHKPIKIGLWFLFSINIIYKGADIPV